MSAPRRVSLGTWPTPLEPAPRLAVAVGLRPDDLWVKRDDLTGLGGGGNKVRKLEWTCGAAVADGARTLVTTGAPQSNHARLTAAAAARLGLDVVLVLAGDPPVEGGSGGGSGRAGGNLALDALFGARVVWAGPGDTRDLAAAAAEVASRLEADGRRPALIPFGGSSPLGARGYVEAAAELLVQAGDVSTVVTAMGSGGTMAGLVHGLGADRVLGIHCGAVPDPAAAVLDLLAGLRDRPPEDPAIRDGLRLRLDQVGDGYATLTEPVLAALLLAARTEGLVLDPIYTGRALAGLVAAVAGGEVRPGDRTVLLHSGGLPGLFGHPETVARALAELGTFTP